MKRMKVRLRTAHGTYLRAGDVHGEINQANAPGPWEEFDLEEVGQGGPPTHGNGMRHDALALSATFLYDEPFLLTSSAMALPEEAYRRALRAHPGSATFLTVGQGRKSSIRAMPFDPRDKWGLVQDRLTVAISEDKAPIVFVCGPPFWEQQLGKNWDALQALMYDAGFHCARYCQWIVPRDRQGVRRGASGRAQSLRAPGASRRGGRRVPRTPYRHARASTGTDPGE